MPPRKRNRMNGQGTLFQRKAGGPWIARWYDHEGKRRQRSTKTSDRKAAERVLQKTIADAALRREGVVDDASARYATHGRAHLSVHIAAWVAALRAKGVTPKHVKHMEVRATGLLEKAGSQRLSDITESKVQSAIQLLRDDGLGNKTLNHYIKAIKQFTRWLQRDGRLRDNPLGHLSGFNEETDRRHDRRVMSVEELTWLIDTVRQQKAWRSLSGPDRAMLYLVATGTGFRVNELRSLTPHHFQLDATPPVVVLDAKTSKRRKGDHQPLQPQLAERLRAWLEKCPADSPLWPGTWHERAANMLRRDLAAAKQAWLETAQSEDDRREWAKDDFLADTSKDGKVLDFHSLRGTFITFVIQGGATIKQAQMLARHSDPRLTFSRYAPLRVDDAATALVGLPQIAASYPVEGERVPKVRTTEGENGEDEGCENGDSVHPGRIRTYDLRIRSPLLYPAELRALQSGNYTGHRDLAHSCTTTCMPPAAIRRMRR